VKIVFVAVIGSTLGGVQSPVVACVVGQLAEVTPAMVMNAEVARS